MKTRKKVKVIGTEQYINTRTGAVEEMQVMTIEERDANFHKLWLQEIIRYLDIISNQKVKFIFWLMKQMNEKNQIIMTMRHMEEKSGTSLKTISNTIKILIENDFLIKTQVGVYQVNPDVIFKGGKSERMNVLIKYQDIKIKNNEKEKAKEPEFDLKK